MIYYTVSDINKFIKQIFSYEEIFCNISVRGEVSDFIYHKSGNMYFTLKDELSSIKCVMFGEYVERTTFLPQNGMAVVVRGNIGIYEREGIYQIYVISLIEDGLGLIKNRLDHLTLKLMEEGLFDSNKKIPIPKRPKEIGVITAPGGAALQDIINILSRRMPMLKVKVYPVLVQGKGAVESIVSALKAVAINPPDVLIIGRGGGSAEDLSVFNSEDVVREVYKLSIPIISAVGHETDRCLLDLVADLRAPTPSAAAELVCLDIREIKNCLENVMKSIEMCMKNVISRYFINVCDLKNKLDYLSPYSRVLSLYDRINKLFKMLELSISTNLKKRYHEMEKRKILLDSLNSCRVLERGYSIVVDSENSIINSVNKMFFGDVFKIKFMDGECIVKLVEKL